MNNLDSHIEEIITHTLDNSFNHYYYDPHDYTKLIAYQIFDLSHNNDALKNWYLAEKIIQGYVSYSQKLQSYFKFLYNHDNIFHHF